MNRTFAIMAGVAMLATTHQAYGLTIVRNFTTSTGPTNSTGNGTLQDIFNVAADCWEMAIRDTHTVTIEYKWEALGGGTLGVHSLVSEGGTPHRETAALIRFDNDGSAPFFLDGTPTGNSEFGTLTIKDADFGGGVMNYARSFLSATGDAANKWDLYSVALHEIGHALGLSGANNAFVAENADGDIDIQAPRPFAGADLNTISGAHMNQEDGGSAAQTLMYPFINHSNRHLISAVDVVANAEISNFTDLNTNPCNPVPEPATMAVLGVGALALIRRRRK